MALRFNKRIKIAPGIRVNNGKSGVSTTLGGKGASLNVGKKGTHLNAGIAGTGISTRTKISGPREGKQSSRGGPVLAILAAVVVALVLAVWLS
jgi:Protein of unknown function (DUF4236)